MTPVWAAEDEDCNSERHLHLINERRLARTKTMHKILTLRTNLLIIFASATVVGVFLFTDTHPNKALLIGTGAGLGLLAGIFQSRALRDSKEQFRAATTALEVRAAMNSSASGRLATYTVYAAGGILLLTAFTQNESIGFGLFAGYAAFIFVRDSIAFKDCIDLQHAAKQK